MAHKETNSEYNRITGEIVKEFIVDSEDEIESLPSCGSGSMAMVVGEGGLIIFMKNASGQWVKI